MDPRRALSSVPADPPGVENYVSRINEPILPPVRQGLLLHLTGNEIVRPGAVLYWGRREQNDPSRIVARKKDCNSVRIRERSFDHPALVLHVDNGIVVFVTVTHSDKILLPGGDAYGDECYFLPIYNAPAKSLAKQGDRSYAAIGPPYGMGHGGYVFLGEVYSAPISRMGFYQKNTATLPWSNAVEILQLQPRYLEQLGDVLERLHEPQDWIPRR